MGRYDPWKHARNLGLRVVRAPIIAESYWLPDRKTIVLRASLSPVRERASLARHIAAVQLGSDETSETETRESEMLAFENMLSAKSKIHAAAWGTLTAALAVEFGVSAHLLQVALESNLGQ